MKKTICSILFALTAVCSSVFAAGTDAEIMADIVRYHRPRCGGEPGRDGGRIELIDYLDIGGDTKRLARILASLAQTNDAWNATRAVADLEKYGTAEQLPFLYSCATNPVIGDKAVKAVLHIEGVTSNSIAIAQSYLLSSNEFTRAKQHDRSLVCEDLLKRVFELPELSQYRPLCLSVARDFAQNANTMHISLDDAIVAADPTYRYSKRRLSVMRSAQYRCVNPGLYNYVTNAINELVAYPEANLPD